MTFSVGLDDLPLTVFLKLTGGTATAGVLGWLELTLIRMVFFSLDGVGISPLKEPCRDVLSFSIGLGISDEGVAAMGGGGMSLLNWLVSSFNVGFEWSPAILQWRDESRVRSECFICLEVGMRFTLKFVPIALSASARRYRKSRVEGSDV
jgi:hypothetical protein